MHDTHCKTAHSCIYSGLQDFPHCELFLVLPSWALPLEFCFMWSAAKSQKAPKLRPLRAPCRTWQRSCLDEMRRTISISGFGEFCSSMNPEQTRLLRLIHWPLLCMPSGSSCGRQFCRSMEWLHFLLFSQAFLWPLFCLVSYFCREALDQYKQMFFPCMCEITNAFYEIWKAGGRVEMTSSGLPSPCTFYVSFDEWSGIPL